MLGPAREAAAPPGDGRDRRIRRAPRPLRRAPPALRSSPLALALLALCGRRARGSASSTGFVGDFRGRPPGARGLRRDQPALGGANVLLRRGRGRRGRRLHAPENLPRCASSRPGSRQQPEIGGDHLARRRRDAAEPRLPRQRRRTRPRDPRSRRARRGSCCFFGGDDVTRGFVDTKLRSGQRRGAHDGVRLRGRRRCSQRINERLAELPQRLHGRVTGDLVLLRHTVDTIARGELQSIGVALITIYLTLSLLLTSFRVGLFALLPNLLPIAIYYGVLGLARRAARSLDEPDRRDHARHRGRRHGALLRALRPRGAPPRRTRSRHGQHAALGDPAGHLHDARALPRLPGADHLGAALRRCSSACSRPSRSPSRGCSS